MGRIAEINRETKETQIFIKLDIDGKGEAKLEYPVGFMSHMLNTFARHGLFNIEVCAKGDLEVDQHHLVEDTGIVLGQCFAKALGEKRGIKRNGSCLFPMDECLARAAVDISGRAFLFFDGQLSGSPLVSVLGSGKEHKFQTDVVEDFWQGFSGAAGCNLHLEVLRGRSDHHKIEALFKAASRALRAACGIDDRVKNIIPSTKGTLPGFDMPGVLV
ncbi:MAG: imidazoleglycerol-phosphate dehydratase HisB [Treponema sp.]|nr:imidazoleglycerol-phosphate dehydratase HisB [Treponema sp.]MCL2273005.1 imidazoleglycerol-phosphate dehydratase HisB [Treponema sp.]